VMVDRNKNLLAGFTLSCVNLHGTFLSLPAQGKGSASWSKGFPVETPHLSSQ
jgi:hypothetical protein